MQQKLIQFQQFNRDPNLVVPKFIMYNLKNNGPEVAWINIKYDVDLEFSCKEIKKFLMSVLGIDDARCSTLIKNEVNQKNKLVKYHGTIQDHDVINFITSRKQENSKFTDNNGVEYTLMEIGVNINDTYNPVAYQAPSMIYYDEYDRALEIKFFKSGDPNTRIIVNVHFNHNKDKTDTMAAIQKLDNLISEINCKPEVKNQIAIASKVSISDFTQYGYSISQASLPYYFDVSQLYIRAKENSLLNQEEKLNKVKTFFQNHKKDDKFEFQENEVNNFEKENCSIQ